MKEMFLLGETQDPNKKILKFLVVLEETCAQKCVGELSILR